MTTTNPKYADGWYMSDGRLRYRPPADPLAARRRLTELIGDEPPPLVRAVAIGLMLPRPDQVDHVRAELAKAPADELRAWQAAGGQVDVVAGANASHHEKTSISLLGVHTGGWYSRYQQRIVIAADSPIEPPVVALHELGHAIDATHKLSTTSRWENAIGRRDHFISAGLGEEFAQSFALFYHDRSTRALLPPAVRAFFRETFSGFAAEPVAVGSFQYGAFMDY